MAFWPNSDLKFTFLLDAFLVNLIMKAVFFYICVWVEENILKHYMHKHLMTKTPITGDTKFTNLIRGFLDSFFLTDERGERNSFLNDPVLTIFTCS